MRPNSTTAGHEEDRRRRPSSLTGALWTERSARRHPSYLLQRLHAVPDGERTNTLTHALAAIAFALLGAGLTYRSWAGSRIDLAIGLAIFTASLVLLYTASALYHAEANQTRKSVLRILDHCSIYILIAGSYAPFAIDLGGAWGFALLVWVWLLAVAGTLLRILATVEWRWLSVTMYLAMGWSALLAAEPFFSHFSHEVTSMLVLGGVVYTLGIPFYLLSRFRYMHAVWHLFVILGSTLHFVAAASLVAGV